MFDYVVIGSGLAGSVIAERIANGLNKKVLVIEKRSHIGGNVYDCRNEFGLYIHKYGPHIFHTDLKQVWDYLSQFTDWIPYQHEVLAFLDGVLAPLPFNLNSLRKVFPDTMAKRLEEKLLNTFQYNAKIPILELKASKDEDLRFLAAYIYEKVYVNYTSKQWNLTVEELDSSVSARVPVHISKDNRYFQDKYQGLPKNGYTSLIKKLLAHPLIKIMLNTDFKEVMEIDTGKKELRLFGEKYKGLVIYTAMLDELFDCRYGVLPYRSLQFEFETFDRAYYQDAGQINYPNNYDYTRITEYKRLTGQISQKTTIAKEYPCSYNRFSADSDNIPYYPVNSSATAGLYGEYRQAVAKMPAIIPVGRLAEYTYYDMDKVVNKALQVFDGLRG